MSDTQEYPVEEIDPHSKGKKLFKKGLITYYILAVFGVLYGLLFFRSAFGIAGGVAVAACFVIAPSQLRKGSEGWKTFTHLFGLFLAMGTFAGGCAVVEESSRTLGFFSLAVFLLSCFLVKVFGYNQNVASYMAHLRSTSTKP